MRTGSARFGPVSFETLAAWAREGRIGPGSEVSPDLRVWRNAGFYPALRMDWVAGLSPGRFYGPMHSDAAEELLRSGELPSAAVFYRRAELGARPGLTPAAADALRGELERAAEGRRRAEALLAAERAARAEDAGRWREESGALAERARGAEAAAETLRGEGKRAAAAAAARAEADGRRIREAESERDALAARETAARLRVKKLEADLAAAEKKRARDLAAAEEKRARDLAVAEERRARDLAAAEERRAREKSGRRGPVFPCGPGAGSGERGGARPRARPVVWDAEIVSVEMDAERPAEPAPAAGRAASFGEKGAESLAALERQLQWELSRLGGRPGTDSPDARQNRAEHRGR